ncbi:Uncharacterised protein [Klebsiella michiganensis]|uniref:Uncharacterized protein n=1 Tax=Klebsiella michiganensis TaxID=1134687 RepID=A0A7H4MYE4_9ENTR|nr:Uncharacterised protein [Klebsiella michiganensis]
MLLASRWGDFIGDARRDNRVFALAVVIAGQTRNGETAANQLCLGEFIHGDFFNEVVIREVKINIAF